MARAAGSVEIGILAGNPGASPRRDDESWIACPLYPIHVVLARAFCQVGRRRSRSRA